MNSYSSMLIDALILGFVLYTLIHGSLAAYIRLARPAASYTGSGSNIPLVTAGLQG